MTVPEQKSALRREMRLRFKAVTPEERTDASTRVCAQIRAMPAWQKAGTVLLYAPFGNELDVWPLVEEALVAGKAVALPQYLPETDQYQACQVTDLGRDLASGNLSIREPSRGCSIISINQLDVMVVPGLYFALTGYRLGRGKGYYDRLLAQASGLKCGVAYDWQVGAHLPSEAHDVCLDCIITPSLWRAAARERADVK